MLFSNNRVRISALFLILAVGAFIRFYGVNWDAKSFLHPDERKILMVVNDLKLPSSWEQFLSVESPLNPGFFAYGSFPMYLLKSAQLVGDKFSVGKISFLKLKILGRVLSVIFDLFTITVVYSLGKRCWGRKEGILAAFLYATTVFLIQGSHFYAVDIQLTFWCTLAVLLMMRVFERPAWKRVLSLAVVVGFAGATKITAMFLFAPLIVCFILMCIKLSCCWVADDQPVLLLPRQEVRHGLEMIVLKSILLIMISVSIFCLLQPYILIDFRQFREEVLLQARMSKDALLFPYTIQFAGTLPYWYFLKNIFLWGLGLPLSMLVIVGFGYGLFVIFNRFTLDLLWFVERGEKVIITSWVVLYFLMIGGSAVKFMRYMMPLYPFFALMSAYGLIKVTGVLGRLLTNDELRPRLPADRITNYKLRVTIYHSLPVMFLIFHLCYTLAFLRIYAVPHTRVSATEWIHQNLPAGSVIALEHWDDTLPLYGGEKFNLVKLELYATDDPLKAQETEEIVNRVDYIIISSKRLYKSIPRLPHKYAWATRYYRGLLSDSLGFEKIAEFTSYPRIELGQVKLELNDDGADESFTVYDHPKVMIFRKRAQKS